MIPQFVSHDAPAGEVAVFGVLFAVLGFVALATSATVLGLTRRAVPRRRLREAVLRTSGGLLMLFGGGSGR